MAPHVLDMNFIVAGALLVATGLICQPLVVVGCSSARAGQGGSGGGTATTRTSVLERAEICEVTNLLLRSRINEIEGSGIVEQPCTKRTATLLDRVAVDVSLRQDSAPPIRPLDRDDMCGSNAFRVACDRGPASASCSSNRTYNRYWKVKVELEASSDGHIKGTAAVLPYDRRCQNCAVVSPCGPTRVAEFKKQDGTWKEIWNRYSKKEEK